MAITARPSYSRIRSALTALGERNDVELQVVAAASALLDRYGNAVGVTIGRAGRVHGRSVSPTGPVR